MASGYGQAGHIGLATETEWGTAVGAADYVEALNESVAESIDRFETRNIIGGLYEPDDMDGIRRIAGDVVLPAIPESAGFFFAGVTGIQSNSEVLSGFLHLHEFTMATADVGANNPVTPLTLEIFRDVTSAQQYDGIQTSQLQISAAPNQDVRLTATVIGKSSRNIAATTPSFVSSSANPFAFDTASISIGGAATAKVEGFNITIDNQLEGVPTLNNSTAIAKVRRTGSQTVRLSGTLCFEDIVDLERFRNQTEFAFTANFTRADSFSMLVDVPRAVFNEFPVAIADRGRQVISFNTMGRYHVGSASAIRLSLTNTRSGY